MSSIQMLVAIALENAVETLRLSESLFGRLTKREAASMAHELLRFVIGKSEVDSAGQLTPSQTRTFRRLVARASRGVPVPYLTGRTEFMGLSLEVKPGTFVPRGSTGFLAAQAVRRLRGRPEPLLIDVATGVGPVALAVGRSIPSVEVLGIDISRKAAALARRNAARLGISNVRFLVGDLFCPVPRTLLGRAHVVTANLPYLPQDLVRAVQQEFQIFEPLDTLSDFSGTGSDLIRRFATETPRWLRPGGWVLVEVTSGYSRGVAALLRQNGFRYVRSIRGPEPWARVVAGRRG